MAKTKIEDISAVEDIDKAEQEAVQGGGLKKWKKKARKAATSESTQNAGMSAIEGTASAGRAIAGAANTTGSALESAGISIEDEFHHSRQSDENAKAFTP